MRSNRILKNTYLLVFFILNLVFHVGGQYYVFPQTNSTWTQLFSTGETKWSARNGNVDVTPEIFIVHVIIAGHATCLFKNKIWLTGGRSESHTLYNLLYSVRNNDVWHSDDGGYLLQDINSLFFYFSF